MIVKVLPKEKCMEIEGISSVTCPLNDELYFLPDDVFGAVFEITKFDTHIDISDGVEMLNLSGWEVPCKYCGITPGSFSSDSIVLESNNQRFITMRQKTIDAPIEVNAFNSNMEADKDGYPFEIAPGDMVMLLNYYRYIKDNDIKCDFINPNGQKDAARRVAYGF